MKTRYGAALFLFALLFADVGVQVAAWRLLPFVAAILVVVLSTLGFLYLLRQLQARWHANGWV